MAACARGSFAAVILNGRPVYASATADRLTIEITVRSDFLLDMAKVLTELELI